MIESGQLKAENLRLQLTMLLEIAQSLPPTELAALVKALEQLDAVVEEFQSTDDELRRLVSELEAAHEVVEAERRRYLDLFEFAPNGYIVTDPDGAIREANRAAADLLNLPPQQLRRSPLVTFVEARYRRGFRNRMRRLQREDRLAEWDLELRPRGRPTIQATLSVATIRARDDRVVGLRWIVRDITERRRMQDTLRFLAEASARLAGSLNYEATLPDIARLAVPRLADWCAIFTGERNQEPRQAAVAAADPRREEVLRRITSRLASPALPPDLPLSQALLQGQPCLIDEGFEDLAARVFETKDLGPALHVLDPHSAVVAPLVARGQILGALLLGLSESERTFGPPDLELAEDLGRRIGLAVDNARLVRVAQEARGAAERREQQLAEFVRMMAHDVQQPLTVAHWHLQIMRRALDRGSLEGVQASEEAIEAATERLDAMIRDLVESARLDVGKMHLDLDRVDLAAFISRVARRLVAGPDTGRIRLELEPVAPVTGDPRRLERIFGNLLTNALKYSDAGSEVIVHVGESGGEVVASVADHGIGIAPEELPRLFERGFRSGRATTKAEGLGLGLYITYQLVEAHGGRLWVESHLGEGSTFYVALPVHKDEG